MINNTTLFIVTLFFLHGAIACFIVGYKFWSKKDQTIKLFGLSLIFGGLAFTAWSFLVANHLNNLKILATTAAIFLILSLFSFYLTIIQNIENNNSYITAMFFGGLFALGLFVLRTFIYPAHLIITNNGYLLFNLQSAVQIAYVIAISFTILPASIIVAEKFKKTIINPLIKGSFSTLAIGAIIIATTSNTTLILFSGISISIALFILWITLLTDGKKSLAKIT